MSLIHMPVKAFPPFFSNDSRLLILGSFPSVKSREERFFYGNMQNRFWGLLNEFFYLNAVTTEQKMELLTAKKIAMWDMVTECDIEGSLDSNIRNYKVSDLSIVLDNAPIRSIFLNGLKAKEIFVKHYHNLCPKAVFLPSTSPANTRLDRNIWLNALKEFYAK